MIDTPLTILMALATVAGFFGLLIVRGQTLLTFFQQEEYDNRRFLAWVREARVFDRVFTFLALVVYAGHAILGDQGFNMDRTAAVLVVALLGHAIWRGRALNAGAKKPLVMTDRAKRILAVHVVLAAFLAGGLHAALGDIRFAILPLTILVVQLVPLTLVLANLALRPAERKVKAGFLAEAKAKMAASDVTVIAITGSYGKTSTKGVLSHILAAVAPTLATPGSVNTEMGITRIIREQLKPEHRYFIVEMGAYGPGSIEQLCKLTPPDHALITAIGAAHFERFKTIDTVYDAKFEVLDATTGTVIVNRDTKPAKRLRETLDAHGARLLVCGIGDGDIEAQVRLATVSLIRTGLALTIEINGTTEAFAVPLYGRHQAENIMMAIAMAVTLKVPMDAIRAALRSLPQTRHRLEVSLSDQGPGVVDDAYNSNPVGFRAALEVLDTLVDAPGRRMLITPGMVELGDAHDAAHREVGLFAGPRVDKAAIVTADRIPTFVEAIRETANESADIQTFATQAEAEAWIKSDAGPGDVILFENNLPDLYEARLLL